MRINRIFTMIVVICLLTTCFSAVLLATPPVNDVDSPTFSLEVEKAESPGEITVHLFVKNVVDVYAFDVVLQYDASKLKLIDSHSALQGLSVNPILESNQLRFAHTQIGLIPGKSGDLKLATFVFKQIQPGSSNIKLHQISLVLSNLDTVVYHPGFMLHMEDLIPFIDISGHWAEEAIMQAALLGIVDGYEDDTFRPQRQTTRAEFVVMLIRALQLEPAIKTENPFKDDDLLPLWAKPYIYTAANQEILFAYEDRTFRPERPITRIEMIAIVVRAIGMISTTNVKMEYKDVDQIPAWGYDYVATATASGLVQGRPGPYIAPNEHTTRAEATLLLLNLLETLDSSNK